MRNDYSLRMVYCVGILMHIHWIMTDDENNDLIYLHFLDLNKDGRRATFYEWYAPSNKKYVLNEDTFRNWIMVF